MKEIDRIDIKSLRKIFVVLIRQLTLVSITLIGCLELYGLNPKAKICEDELYNTAYSEIADMLDGKTLRSIKRAVFLVEWAYLEGKLDYDSYSKEIETAAAAINRFIAANNLAQHSKGKNYTLFEYFCHPYSINDNKPFTYDYYDPAGNDDFAKTFVTKLMQTHLGQCTTLPTYYKILADEIGAEAYLTLAPQHMFIRHRDEFDSTKWINVELTTHSLSRELFYIEHFGITDEMIRNKVYLKPLNDVESVALLLTSLTFGYINKYGADDNFVAISSNKAIEYFPQNINALMNRCNAINLQLVNYLKSNGNILDDYAKALDNKWYEYNESLQRLNYRDMDEAIYLNLVKGALETMKKKGISDDDIEKERIRYMRSARNKRNN